MDFDFQADNYIVPWCRFQPYAVGIIVGMLLHKTREIGYKMNRIVTAGCWILATCLGLSVIYGLDPLGQHNAVENATYGGLNRLAWAVAVGWLIFACSRGYGGWINTFLSWEAFTVLSRVTFVMYLLHSTIILVVLGTFTFVSTVNYFLGVSKIFTGRTVTILSNFRPCLFVRFL